MKMTKKVLLGAVALGLAFGVASCKDPDDENGMISGSSKNYTIDYENPTNDVSRGYVPTTFSHYGELVKFTFNNTKKDAGVLGFIWDLKETDGLRNFFVLGLAVNRTDTNGTKHAEIQAYASKFFNVTEDGLQLQNFGASTSSSKTSSATLSDLKDNIADGVACELDVTKQSGNGGNTFQKVAELTDSVIWADIYPATSATHKPGTKDAKNTYTGGYVIDIYVQEDEPTEDDNATKTITISPSDAGHDTEAGDKFPQNKLAVYANVYAQSTLDGAWYLAKDYFDAEVIEDAE